MDLHEHVAAIRQDRDAIEDVPLTILREVMMMYVEETVAKERRSERQAALRANSRRVSSSRVDDQLSEAIERATDAVARTRTSINWNTALLDMEFPVEHGGEVKRLGDFTLEDIARRRKMLKTNAESVLLGISTLDQAYTDIVSAGVSTLYEAVRLAS